MGLRANALSRLQITAAPESIVDRFESVIIVPGQAHEDLWVHPELLTSRPGNPPRIELRAVSTDRYGRDKHSLWHYYQTDDLFETLTPLQEPREPNGRPDHSVWQRKGLHANDLLPAPPSLISPPSALYHTWSTASLEIDPDTIVQAFTTSPEPVATCGKDGFIRGHYHVQTLIARRHGSRFLLEHISNHHTVASRRGLYEPHLAQCQGRLFMTARAEDGHGYILVSEDGGRFWEPPRPWCWDDGSPIAMDQTMTKLLAHSDGLALVYTRIREDNAHVMRHRAPLHCADVDLRTLRLCRATERIIIPDHSVSPGLGSLPMGNFWVWPITPFESYITVAEWPRDGQARNGDIWLTKVYWKRPNRMIAADGREFPLV
ncbi:MAG: hypothetical protein PCFJNLEI_00741 [Verrucomicrobiae bacterium]|nr:hypothetical protein [Verrucomicrobiae bacterium]